MLLSLSHPGRTLALALCLCSLPALAQQYNYTPNSIHYLQVERRHDASLGLGVARGNKANGVEWQAAYSPLRHGAVMVNVLDARHKEVRNQTEEGGSGHFAEIGIGAYETTPRGLASIFVGYGQGSVFNNYTLNRTAKIDYARWFIQPAVTFRSPYFEWGFALRINRLTYSHAEVDYNIDEYDLNAIKAIDAKSAFFMPEFGLHTGIVLRPCTISFNLTSLFYDANSYNFARVNTSILLTVDIGSFYQKKDLPSGQ